MGSVLSSFLHPHRWVCASKPLSILHGALQNRSLGQGPEQGFIEEMLPGETNGKLDEEREKREEGKPE